MSSNIILPTVGSILTGKVAITLASKDEQKKPYGVIVNCDGGVSGLLHVSQMAGNSFNARNQRLASLKRGDEVTVEVVEVTAGEKPRIALSEKSIADREQATKHEAIIGALTQGTEVTGVVEVVKETFAIVILSDGPAAGLGAILHASQLPGASPKERDAQVARLTVGQTIAAEIHDAKVEDNRLRISLSQRAAAVRKQLERFAVGTTHTGDIAKRLDNGFVVNFGAVSGVLSDEEACSTALKVGGRVRARVSFVSADGKVTLSRRGLK
jgi:small subunit ribosomal protein S1